MNGRAVRAAVQRLQHRRLDLEIVQLVERAPDLGRHARARAEQRAHLGMHREIGVALAVPLLGIRESGVANRHAVHDLLLPERQRAKRLRQQLHLGHPHRHFAGARSEQRARDADHVADVEQIERRVRLVAQLRPS